jgi:hypothetical protein
MWGMNMLGFSTSLPRDPTCGYVRSTARRGARALLRDETLRAGRGLDYLEHEDAFEDCCESIR